MLNTIFGILTGSLPIIVVVIMIVLSNKQRVEERKRQRTRLAITLFSPSLEKQMKIIIDLYINGYITSEQERTETEAAGDRFEEQVSRYANGGELPSLFEAHVHEDRLQQYGHVPGSPEWTLLQDRIDFTENLIGTERAAA